MRKVRKLALWVTWLILAVVLVNTNAQACSPSVTIKEISFLGDNPMYQNSVDYGGWGVGPAINDPVWTNTGSNAPVCYTKGSTVSMMVKFDVHGNLDSGVIMPVTLLADGPENLDASVTFNVTGNDTVEYIVILTTAATLTNVVYSMSATFAWKIICCTTTNSFLSTTHTIYVTYGTPAGSEATQQRIADVCGAAYGQASLSICADAIFTHLGSFKYDPNGPIFGPSPIWLLHAGSPYSSQCPGLADFINKHFQLLGLGAGAIKYCRALPDGTYAAQDTALTYSRSCAAGDNGHPNPTTHDDVSPTEWLLHLDASDVPNNYEATCFFNGRYYALGVGIFDTPKQVVTTSFGEINWFYSVTNKPPWNVESCDISPWTEAP